MPDTCTRLCELRATCSTSADAACGSDCKGSLPARCTTLAGTFLDCIERLSAVERCSDMPIPCPEEAAAMADCVNGGDGQQSPANPDLARACIPFETCGGDLACMEASAIGGMICTTSCNADSDCPENGLCLVFDGDEGHYCARRCETDTDCAGTGGSCITGGEQIYGRNLCSN